MNLKTKKVTITLPEYRDVKEIIKSSFPKTERIPFFLLMIRSLAKDVSFVAYYDCDKLCGIAYIKESDKYVFVLYLAVNGKLHSIGYRTAILSKIKEEYNDKIICLNVEAIEENAQNKEQRSRRMAFYNKNGFATTDWYVTDDEKYMVMSTDKNISIEEYRFLLKKLSFVIDQYWKKLDD